MPNSNAWRDRGYAVQRAWGYDSAARGKRVRVHTAHRTFGGKVGRLYTFSNAGFRGIEAYVHFDDGTRATVQAGYLYPA